MSNVLLKQNNISTLSELSNLNHKTDIKGINNNSLELLIDQSKLQITEEISLYNQMEHLRNLVHAHVHAHVNAQDPPPYIYV